jgi:hypothetical protein
VQRLPIYWRVTPNEACSMLIASAASEVTPVPRTPSPKT